MDVELTANEIIRALVSDPTNQDLIVAFAKALTHGTVWIESIEIK